MVLHFKNVQVSGSGASGKSAGWGPHAVRGLCISVLRYGLHWDLHNLLNV